MMKEIKCIEKVITGGIIEEIVNLLKREKCFIYVSEQLMERLEKEYFQRSCFFWKKFAINEQEQWVETTITVDDARIPWRNLLQCYDNGEYIDHRGEAPDIIYFLK